VDAMADKECVFCKIIAGELPSKVYYEDNYVKVVADINPSAEFHALVLPKKHIKKFTDIEKKHILLIGKMIKIAQNIIDKHRLNKAYKIIFNGGKYQIIDHLHMHIIGGKIKGEI
jgi:histidine triad (HIT) family protein